MSSTMAHHAEEGPSSDEASPTVLTFALGEQVLAVDVTCVREILDPVAIRPLPDAPHDVIGMIDLRGQAVAIVDIAARAGTARPAPGTGRIVVFTFDRAGEPVMVGAQADRVLRVTEIPREGPEPLPTTLSGWRSDVARGLLRDEDGVALLIDAERLLGGTPVPGPFAFD